MRYIVATEAGTDTTAFGVVVPDLPGWFSVPDTLDERLGSSPWTRHCWRIPRSG